MGEQPSPWISPEEFLEQEALSGTKHMYCGGAVATIAGGTYGHGRIAGNLIGVLFAALRGKGCGVVGGDVMLQTGSPEVLVYPDVMVIPEPVAKLPNWPHVVTNPVFVAEVISPSTEAVDRGAKSLAYRSSASIRQYALIAQDQPWVEIRTRDEAGVWRIEDVTGLGGICAFTGIDCAVPMASLYEGVLEV